MSELTSALNTPSMARNCIIGAKDRSVGQIDFGQRNTPSRPPKAPSATR